MSSESTIDYELLTQDAMRGVVRRVLEQTVDDGLPGDHHFYISFDTLAPGVILSKRLREKYAQEMTIVLQHRFWDLAVGEDYFEVKLTFDGIPERLVVPFAALKVFFDPSVRYGLQFETSGIDQEGGGRPPAIVLEHGGDIESSLPSPLSQQKGDLAVSKDPMKQPVVVGPSFHEANTDDKQSELTVETETEAVAMDEIATDGEDVHEEDVHEEDAAQSAKIVSLDSFRKK